MRIYKSIVSLFLAINICIFAMLGCEKQVVNNISFSDVVCDRLDLLIMDDTLIKDGNIYSNLLVNYTDANTILNNIGVSASALSVYDEDYFTDNDLLIIAFDSVPGFKYTISSLVLNDNVLTVNLDKHVPKALDALKIYEAMLIDIPKGTLPDDVSIEVQFNEIMEE